MKAAIYRTGAASLDDFDNLKSTVRFNGFGDSSRHGDRVHLTWLHALKVDYVHSFIQPGFVYTLPAKLVASLDAGGPGVQALLIHPVVFKCMSKDTLAKKHVQTARLAAMRSMKCPIVVQMYESHGLQGFPGTHHQVYPSGHGHEVDMLDIADWQSIYKDLTRWSKDITSSVPGCITIRDPHVVANRTWYSLHDRYVFHRYSMCMP